MGLFGSLFTGVSGLNAQSQNTAIIANNIANVSTVGYKRSETSFLSLVTTESRLSRYSPGTVSTNRIQKVNEQGGIQQTSSSSDVSISGNGLLPVKRSTDNDSVFMYTRNGQLSEDSQGFLTNSAGFILYAWPVDGNENLPASQGDLTSLVPANVSFLGGLTRPTSSAQISINLDAQEISHNPVLFTPSTVLPIPEGRSPHFQRGLRVFDSLGAAQDINFEFRKIPGPMANATTGASTLARTDNFISSRTPGIAAGDTFSITVTPSNGGAAVTETYIIGAAAGVGQTRIDTVQDLLSDINSNFGAGSSSTTLQASLDSTGRILFQTTSPTALLTFAETVGTPLTGVNTLSLLADASGDGTPLTYAPQAEISDTFTTYPNQVDFPGFANVTNPNTQGWWEVTIRHPDGTPMTQGLLNFNTDGTLNATLDTEGNIDVQLSNINWGNGSDSTQSIDVDIERFTQFAGDYNVVFSNQNGAELGLRTGIEIDRDGYIVAQFSNGASSRLYKIPLITFTNANGLNEESGTAYTKSEESGEENLREAGTGGAGFFEPSTLENSNVDLADEFARLIVANRAYSANTRVISTADEMMTELLRLGR